VQRDPERALLYTLDCDALEEAKGELGSTSTVMGSGDDHSASFGRIRGQVTDKSGVPLADFVKNLSPRYRVVYRDIAIGYLMIAFVVALSVAAALTGLPWWLVAPLTAIGIGYWVAYVMLFIHEGAHGGLSADGNRSDRLTNLLIGWWAGMDVVSYRKTHFRHHRELGTTRDSEISYFFPLDLMFVVKLALGMRVIEVLRSRQSPDRQAEAPATRHSLLRLSANRQLLTGVLVHAAITVGLALLGLWPTALGWVLGMAIVFPFFGALRQVLEHRSFDARNDVDYRQTDHGATSRIFGDGLFSGTFGGAGFNRHLLHHWEPTVSYTRLRDMEAFLMSTALRDVIETRRSTYPHAMLRLIHPMP